MFATLWKKIILTAVGSILALGGAGVAGYKLVENHKLNKLAEEPQLVVDAIDGDTIKPSQFQL
ncbi:hypothetical protein KKD19_00400 [Patescibacteria group bacterium]|nr:hypothetical protein [Patescibacteria group bacterium]MCG2688757.1 hypothetical protein [Candidatus Parcubacteria bacterium]